VARFYVYKDINFNDRKQLTTYGFGNQASSRVVNDTSFV